MIGASPRPRLGDVGRQLRELGLRVVLARWGVAFAALAAVVVITIRTHWYFIRPYAMPVMNDEGYITAMALRMVKGHWLPYVDGISQRGPILYWLGTLVMRIGGLFSWTPLRVLSLCLALSNEALVFLLGLELMSPFAAGVAVLVQTYFFTFEVYPSDAIGYNGEIVGAQFVLLSALLVARAQTRPPQPKTKGGGPRSRAPGIVAAGVFAACAGLSKQVTLVHVAPALFWLFVGPSDAASAGTMSGGGGRRWTDVAWYLLGFGVPYAVVLLVYGASGHLRDFVYYYQRYGRDIFMAPLKWPLMRAKLEEQIDKYLFGIMGVAFLTLCAAARTVRAHLATPRAPGAWRARVRANAPSVFLLLHFVLALVGASFTWRFFPHYFVQAYPFLGLVAAYALSEPFDGMDEHQTPKVFGGVVVVAGATMLLGLANFMLHRNIALAREGGQWYQDPQSDPIVRYVEEATRPLDTIFVWGFRAEIYVSAHRYPASRYIYAVYPAGVVPWFNATPEEEERRVVPGSRELLVSDLDDSKPELIVDAGRSMDGRYMHSIPVLREYLEKTYCFVRYIDGEPIYRLRHGDDCPPPDSLQ